MSTSNSMKLTLEEQIQRIKDGINATPHNEEIIPPGRRCRAADYVDNLSPDCLRLLDLAYSMHRDPYKLACFLSQASERALIDDVHKRDAAALSRSICSGSLAAHHTPLGNTSPMRGVIINSFVKALRRQWQTTRTDVLLHETIEYFRKAITYGPRDGPYRDIHLIDLGEQLRERYFKFHRPQDFDEASRCFETSLELRPAGSPIVSMLWAGLKEEKNKFDRVKTLQVLNEYIDTLSNAVRVIPPAFDPRDYHQSFSSVYWRLGYALTRRFELTKAIPDYQKAVSAFEEAKNASKNGKKDDLWICLGLGRLELAEYTRNGNNMTADKAESYLKEANEMYPDTKDVMEFLGEFYRLQAQYNESFTILTEAVRLLERCVELSGHSQSSFLLFKAAYAHMDLYKRCGKKEDIDRAIDLLFQATLRDDIPLSQNKAEDQILLAEALVLRFENAEDEEDLDIALSIIEEAENEDSDESTRIRCFRTHGKVFNAWYRAQTVLADLELAITYYQKAVDVPAADGSQYLTYNDLGNALLSRYRATGNKQSLLDSGKKYGIALHLLKASTWKDHKSTESMILQGLASTQLIQFEVSQRQSDIDTAVTYYQLCYDKTPPNHILRVSRGSNLAQALQKRFELTTDIKDVQKSQKIVQEVLQFGFPLPPSDVSNLQNLLGSAYLRSYGSNKQLYEDYLNSAQEHYQESLASGCTIPSYVRTASLNLSTVYRNKASITGKFQDMILAVKLFHQQLETLSTQEEQQKDPKYEITLFNMAELVFAMHDLAEKPPMKEILDHFMKFVPSFAAFKTLPRSTIARIYLKLAVLQFEVTSQPAEALRLVQAAAEELPGSVLLQSLNRTEQLMVIRNLTLVPSMCIMFSLMAGQSAESALHLFEASRSVLWDNVLANKLGEQTRSMLHSHPELESKFKTLREALSKSVNVDAVIDPSSADVLRQAEQFDQAVSYNQLLEEIRSKPGLQDFLRLPRDSASLQKYASEGPIVIVNGAPIRSDAIIIRNDGVFSVRLPLFTKAAYEKMRAKQLEALAVMGTDVERSNGFLTQVLKDLWTTVAEPILDALGFRGGEGADGTLPRLWWLTTGWIGNLPIHAAGDHETVLKDGAPRSVIDRVVSSYVGNIRGLDYLRSRQSPETKDPSQRRQKQALLVEMPITPNMPDGDLPQAGREVDMIEDMCKKAGFKSKTLDKPKSGAASHPDKPKAGTVLKLVNPKTGTVLRLVKGADLVHCACHGVSSKSDPLDSMLRLTDWVSRPLSIGELLKTNDLSCQLVYLSACETALNRFRQLEDEGLHLAGAFQLAGAVHVVASLWRVDDDVSVDVATGFYGRLVTAGGFDIPKSALSLKNTLAEIRKKGVKAVHWASYIHLGP